MSDDELVTIEVEKMVYDALCELAKWELRRPVDQLIYLISEARHKNRQISREYCKSLETEQYRPRPYIGVSIIGDKDNGR